MCCKVGFSALFLHQGQVSKPLRWIFPDFFYLCLVFFLFFFFLLKLNEKLISLKADMKEGIHAARTSCWSWGPQPAYWSWAFRTSGGFRFHVSLGRTDRWKNPHYQTNVKAHKHNDCLLPVIRRQRNKCTTSENKALSVSINTPTL